MTSKRSLRTWLSLSVLPIIFLLAWAVVRDFTPTRPPAPLPPNVDALPPSLANISGADQSLPAAQSSDPIPEPTTPLPTTSPPAPAKLPKPWQAALDPAIEPLGHAQIAFQTFDESFNRSDRENLNSWFERTANAGLRIGKIPSPYGQSGTLEGIGRLMAPWPQDAVLRLQLDNFNRLKMHFFHGLSGVTLVYYEDGYRWAAYATTRDEEKPTPKTWAITATDDDRCRRTEFRFGGPVDLYYDAGELVLSRGDVVLLAAPLAGPPSDVFFEGRATVHGIAVARAKDLPASQAKPGPLNIRWPADLTWTATQPHLAKPELTADGSLRLVGDRLDQNVECFAAVSAAEIHELIFELADVTAGTAVYLGRDDGRPQEVFSIVRDRQSGQLAIQHVAGDMGTLDRDLDSPSDKPSPLVQTRCWLRVLYGCGNLRWWISTDGIHWAQTHPASDDIGPGLTTIGLQLAAGQPKVGLTLRQVASRPLHGLNSLASKNLIDQAAPLSVRPLDEWLKQAVAQKPSGIETTDWLRACTIRTLAAGARRELAYSLLEALLDDAAGRGLSVEQQLAALDDAMLMTLDLRDRHAMRIGIPSRYARLGLQAADHFGLPAWSSVSNNYHSAGALTWMQAATDVDRAIRSELVTTAHRDDPQQARGFLALLRFFHQHRDRGLVEWLDALARQDGREGGEERSPRVRDSWREMLAAELDKETYNALTELKAVLDSQTWDDAARLVASLDPQSEPGVAPYINDKSLLISLPVALQLTLEDFPKVRQAIAEQFAALGKLRVAEATAGGNVARVELATVQFESTPAAAEAHRWLGDRALVAGSFARAFSHYERATTELSDASAEIAARKRLAAAMLGRDWGQRPTQFVKFGDSAMSPEQFESLVDEMRNRGATEAPLPPADWRVPPPSKFESHVRSRLDGPVGDRPQEEIGRRTNQHRVPWVDRQIATVVEGETLYVANHFQVAAYRLTSGERIWQSQTPPGPMQRAQEWTMIPMRPLVAGDRIFMRLLYSANPILACFEKSTGKLLWVAERSERELIISDPLFIEGRLVTLGLALQPDQQGLLRHYTFDPRTGELLAQRDLIRVRSTWGSRSCCEVVAIENGMVAVLGGAIIALDTSGNLRWARSQQALPAEEDPRWVLQMFQRPVVDDNRLYISQPGVRTVDCLAADTGRRYWRAILPEVVGIVGQAGELLIVRTETDIRALSTHDGTISWRYTADDIYSFQLLDSDGLLIAHRERAPKSPDLRHISLIWLDPTSGAPVAVTALPKLSDSDPRLGPLVAFQDRLFTFFGRGQHEATRDLIELVPAGDASSVKPKNAWDTLQHGQSPL